MKDVKPQLERAELAQLLDKSICEMTNRVAGIEMSHNQSDESGWQHCQTLLLRTTGDYKAMLILHMEEALLVQIARTMKHAEQISREDLAIYATEYYNILCGYFISHVNQRHGLRTRFGIPELMDRMDALEDKAKDVIKLHYKCVYGEAEFQLVNVEL